MLSLEEYPFKDGMLINKSDKVSIPNYSKSLYDSSEKIKAKKKAA